MLGARPTSAPLAGLSTLKLRSPVIGFPSIVALWIVILTSSQ
jgi:hypothetical protein